MKIQLDTKSKIIKIENSIKLGELTEALEKLLPKGEWKKYELETNTVINSWTNPIIIREYPQPVYPSYPWIACCNNATDIPRTDGGNSIEFKSGTYNVEL